MMARKISSIHIKSTSFGMLKAKKVIHKLAVTYKYMYIQNNQFSFLKYIYYFIFNIENNKY